MAMSRRPDGVDAGWGPHLFVSIYTLVRLACVETNLSHDRRTCACSAQCPVHSAPCAAHTLASAAGGRGPGGPGRSLSAGGAGALRVTCAGAAARASE